MQIGHDEPGMIRLKREIVASIAQLELSKGGRVRDVRLPSLLEPPRLSIEAGEPPLTSSWQRDGEHFQSQLAV